MILRYISPILLLFGLFGCTTLQVPDDFVYTAIEMPSTAPLLPIYQTLLR